VASVNHMYPNESAQQCSVDDSIQNSNRLPPHCLHVRHLYPICYRCLSQINDGDTATVHSPNTYIPAGPQLA
jgi:hypothetical protein